MARNRADKSWATAYVNEQRQPHGVQGGGRWTAGIIGPAAQGRQGRGGKKPAAPPPADAPAGTEARMAAATGGGSDPEDAAERAQARQALTEAAALEAQIDSLKAELKSVTRQYNALAGPSNTPPSAAGAAPGASTGAAPNNTAAAAAASRSYTQQVNRLQSQSAQLQAQISKLVRQRAKLLTRAGNLMRDAQKSASTTTRSRVASVLTPGAEKAATLAGQDLVYATFPIEKWEDGPDGSLYVYGRATTPEVDTDEQIVDGDWSAKALQAWMDTGPNLRVQHNGQRDPAGSGVRVEINRDGDGAHWVKSVVDEPVAARLVRKGHLRAYSVGIARPVIERDSTGKARGGIIKGGELAELSLVDRPANRSCSLSLVKAAKDGTAEFPGTLDADEGFLAKADAPEVTKTAKPVKTVNVDLPANMSLSIKPSDLARLQTLGRELAQQQAAAKAAAPVVTKAAEPVVARSAGGGTGNTATTGGGGGGGSTGEPFTVLKAVMTAEADIYKRDIDTATRQRLASQGRALPDGSYPVETHEDAGNAVTLALSGHGNAGAAKKMLRRIAAREGWQDILDRLGGKGSAAAAKAAGKDAGRAEAKARKAVRAALTPAAEPEVVKKKGKLRAICPGCGAKQNPAHAHCPECGGKLPAGVPVVAKNHDFVCLGCGKEQDKGEKFCPQCGKENPGFNPAADRKIPANADAGKSGKARVAKGKKGNGKVPGAGVTGQAAGDEKPAGPHREPDGGVVEALERSAGMEDGDDEKPTGLEARAMKGAGKKAKGKKGGKGKKNLPPWLKDKDGDGDGDDDAAEKSFGGDPEMLAALRLKSLSVPQPLGIAHDLTCPAFDPADVAKCYPAASLATLDLGQWQGMALEKAAGGSLADAHAAQGLLQAVTILRAADPFDLADLRAGAHKMFRDANPGPGHAPEPVQVSATRFNRPLITAGHEASSPGHDGPRSAKIPPAGGIHPEDYRRGYQSAGTADDSPGNTHPAGPMAAPGRTGVPTAGPAQGYFRDSARESATHAMRLMHDHISAVFPDLCPMHAGDTTAARPVPVPQGVPAVHPVPGTSGPGKKSAKAEAKKAAKRAERKAVRAGKRKAAKIRAKARTRRRALESKVLKGRLTVEQARQILGLDPIEGTPAAVTKTAEPAAVSQLEPDALKSVVKAATRPLQKQLARQGKALRKVRKTADAIAAQPDTSGAPFRGTALAKSSPAPAGPVTLAKSAEQAQANLTALLYDEWRTSPNPERREAAWAELTRRQLDPSMTRTQT